MALAKKQVSFSIAAPNFQVVEVGIRGTAPLMIHRFSQKAINQIKGRQTAVNKVKEPRKPKDYKAEFNAARYIAKQGWDGFYAGAIRNAVIRAASYGGGLSMTAAKGLIFVIAEGFDKQDGTPLVRIIGKVAHDCRPARNDGGGIDIRNRARFDAWSAKLKVRYDADLLSAQDVLNLLARAGESVGICDGRPGSPNSNGCGFGTFNVEGMKKAKRAPKADQVRAAHSGNGSNERAVLS